MKWYNEPLIIDYNIGEICLKKLIVVLHQSEQYVANKTEIWKEHSRITLIDNLYFAA